MGERGLKKKTNFEILNSKLEIQRAVALGPEAPCPRATAQASRNCQTLFLDSEPFEQILRYFFNSRTAVKLDDF
jgi:hypothetical protein